MTNSIPTKHVFLTILFASYTSVFGANTPNKAFKTEKVLTRDLLKRVTVSGSIFPNRKVIVTAPYNGYIQKFHVELGQTVKKGMPLVNLAPSLQSSPDEINPLRAAFSGQIVQILRSEGEYIDTIKDSALLRIDDLSKVYVKSDIPELFVSKIKKGMDVIVRANAISDKTYTGKINEISLAAKEQGNWNSKDKVEFPIKIEIKDADLQIRSGMSTLVDIIVGKQNAALSLHHEYVLKSPEGYLVTLASGEKKKIETGMQTDEFIEVKSGVKAGDEIRMVDFSTVRE